MVETVATPVLLIGYQRVDTVIKILDAALSIGASQVFVSIDSPKNDDSSARENYKKLKETVDFYRGKFPELKSRFLTSNLGCSLHVLSSIDWAFESVDELIILEDDCIPSQEFFAFVNDGLDIMKRQPEIALVCGTQQVPSNLLSNIYYKSKYSMTWGWATTKTSWAEIKSGMKEAGRKININLFELNAETIYWQEGARRAYEGFVDVWDTPLVHYLHSNGKFALLPPVNLVMNVGNDSAATHMRGERKWLFRETGNYVSQRSSEAKVNSSADDWLLKHFYRIQSRHLITTRLTRLNDSIKNPNRQKIVNRWTD